MTTLKVKEFCMYRSSDGDYFVEWVTVNAKNFIKVNVSAGMPMKALLKEAGYKEVKNDNASHY